MIAERLVKWIIFLPVWRALFLLARPIDHVAAMRVGSALGYRFSWRHLFGVTSIRALDLEEEDHQDAM